MKLNLKQVLGLAGIAKPKFDSARRRDMYGFMYSAVPGDDPVATYENTRNRFGIEHVVGLMCVEYAVEQLGMSVEIADSIVSNNFGGLTEAIRDGSIDPDTDEADPTGSPINHTFVGAVFNVVGRGHHTGLLSWFHDKILAEVLRGGEHSDNQLLGVQMIDATTVYRLVKTKMIEGLGL